jgi:hypothetical protein
MGLGTLVSNIDHVARLEGKRVQRTALINFTSFVRDLEMLKNALIGKFKNQNDR